MTTKIIISYSHKDEVWKNRIMTHLRVLTKDILALEDHKQFSKGEDNQDLTKNFLSESNLVLLLISPAFLISSFIQDKFPSLLQKVNKEEVNIIPVILEPCTWKHVPWIRDLQVYPKNDKALSSLSVNDANVAIVSLMDEIAAFLQRQKSTLPPEPFLSDDLVLNLEHIEVDNFRLFKSFNCLFHPRFNLIVGVNGSGKSSLLNLLSICICAWLEEIGFNDPIDKVQFSPYDLRTWVVESSGELRFEFSTFAKIIASRREISTITKEIKISDWIRDYWRDWNGDIRYDFSYLSPIFQHNTSITLPLYAYYRTDRLWNPISIDPVIITDLTQAAMEARYQRLDGYTGWSNAHTDEKELTLWLLKIDIIAYQKQKESMPLGWQLLQTALNTCYENFDRLRFMADKAQVVLYTLDGKSTPFNQLSDGQRTLFAMIGDMVRRAVLLNPHLGEKVLEETPGIVLIDELDLHLHPKWQRRIIEDLRRTFPKIQFIATTHSPFLIQSLRDGGLIQLDGETGEEYSNASIEDIAENIQGVEMPQKSLRFTQMMEAAEAYYKRLHECADATDPQTQSLKQRLDELSIPFSDDPAFAAFLKFERDTLVAKEDKEA